MLTPKKTNNNMSFESYRSSFNFPFEKLTKCIGEPNNASITILKRQLYANAMSVESTLGCGALGYLGVIMPETDYHSKQLHANNSTQTTHRSCYRNRIQAIHQTSSRHYSRRWYTQLTATRITRIPRGPRKTKTAHCPGRRWHILHCIRRSGC